MSADEDLLAIFRDEVREQLDGFEEVLAADPNTWDLSTIKRAVHNIKGAARMVDAADVGSVAHAIEDALAVAAQRGTAQSDVATLVRAGVHALSTAFDGDPERARRERDAYLVAVEAFGAAHGGESVPRSESDQVASDAPAVEAAADAAKQEREAATRDDVSEDGSVRVSVARLDRLMVLAAELATMTSVADERALLLRDVVVGLKGYRQGRADANALEQSLGRLDALRREHLREATRSTQLTDELHEAIRSLRMVRFDSLGVALRRVVRDACVRAGREAQLTLRGGETEVDRAVLQELRDPLLHLLRNAVVHGLESSVDRAARDKPREGQIVLQVRGERDEVVVAIEDDGRGIDVTALRSAAVAHGALTADAAAALDDLEALRLAFLPGISTLRDANSLAGRGVGLDVVEDAVRRLGGSVEIHSLPAIGTRFELRVPLTRLVTRVVLARVGTHFVAFPAAFVERTLQVNVDTLQRADDGPTTFVGGERLRVRALEKMLLVSSSGDRGDAGRPAVVVNERHAKLALLVDEVVGHRELLVRPLPWNLRGLGGVSAVAVLESGDLVLVLEPRELTIRSPIGPSVATSQAAPSEITRRTILVVDDSVTSRTLERNILAAAGYDVEVAVDGALAWERLKTGGIDLLVTDVEMPELDGLELTRRVRANAETAQLPVIVVTSLGDEAQQRHGASAGADAYVVKGQFDQDELLRAVARLL